MPNSESRWFPGQPGEILGFENKGWLLASGERFDADSVEGGADFMGLRVTPPKTLEVDFLNDKSELCRIRFQDVVDLQIDGSLNPGPNEDGNDFTGTTMIIAERGRDDGRLVYFMNLPNAMVCFACPPGDFTTQ